MSKIINIGAHKTGTTSITEAMRILGFSCAPEELWYNYRNINQEIIPLIQKTNIINNVYIYHNNIVKFKLHQTDFFDNNYIKYYVEDNPIRNFGVEVFDITNYKNLESFGISFRPINIFNPTKYKFNLMLKCNYNFKIYDGIKWINYETNYINNTIEIFDLNKWRIYISDNILKNLNTNNFLFVIEEISLTIIDDSNTLLKLITDTNYEFYEDSPYNFNEFYKVFNENIPDVKFILSIRNSETWINSFIKHSKNLDLNNKYLYSINYAYGKQITEENKKYLMDRYNERNKNIMDYFKNTNKLLVLDIDDKNNFEKIINFFNLKDKKHLNNEKFPHKNVGY